MSWRPWVLVARLWARHQQSGNPAPHHAKHQAKHRGTSPPDRVLAVCALLLALALILAAYLVVQGRV